MLRGTCKDKICDRNLSRYIFLIFFLFEASSICIWIFFKGDFILRFRKTTRSHVASCMHLNRIRLSISKHRDNGNTLGSFSIDDGDGSENVTFKRNKRFFKLCRRCCHSSLKALNENFALACLRPQ